ncbi:MAG: CBS domain-containing protein [Thermoleophilia bacterium]|nr:CBS domain-containing protein [Thermoleophilia bacterium]
MTRILREIQLSEAAVRVGASFAEAAAALESTAAAMVAILDEEDKVVGLFGAEHALRGLLPRYLGELRHTAFARDDADLLAGRAEAVRAEPVERHCAKAVTVDADASAIHVGEIFLHCGLPGVAVVEKGRFVGVLDRGDLARALLRRAGGA